jgi:hypothetical protein
MWMGVAGVCGAGRGWGEAGVGGEGERERGRERGRERDREREGEIEKQSERGREREREREREGERKREREGGREREREGERENIVSYRGERPRQSYVDILIFRSVHLDSCSVSPPAALSISPLLSMWICIAHVLSCTVKIYFVALLPHVCDLR